MFTVWCVLCAVCFIVFSSHVSPARPWQKASNRTPLWRCCIWAITTSALKGRRLGVRWGWCHEGRGSEARPYESDIREMTKRQCNAALISRCIHPVEICDDKWLVYFDVFGMYWPDPGRKEKQFITVLFPKQVTLSFSNVRSSNQVLNGIPLIRIFWKLQWFPLLVTLPNYHSGGRLDWSNMTSDRGTGQMLPKNHQRRYFHLKV